MTDLGLFLFELFYMYNLSESQICKTFMHTMNATSSHLPVLIVIYTISSWDP